MAMLEFNGVAVKSPSVFQWDIMDLSSEESGRSTNDGYMNKDIVAIKRKLHCTWNNPNKDEVSHILQLVTGKPYIRVKYPDSLSGKMETREFTVGDRTTPMKIWTINNKRYSALSFNLIER